MSLSAAKRPAETYAEIAAISKAIERRDAKSARDAMASYVATAGLVVLRLLEESAEQPVATANGRVS